MRDFVKRDLEVGTVAVVYVFFFIIGLYAQTSASFDNVNVEILGPPDGMQFQSTPVELVAAVTNQEGPLSNARARITVFSLTTGETEGLTAVTDTHGIARVLFPAQTGSYSWYVATRPEGYPIMVSRPRGFSSRAELIVDCLTPCSSNYPLVLSGEYVDLQVMVKHVNGNPIESANVTFYVNSMQVYSTLTDARGIASMHWDIEPRGTCVWFASASKNDEAGASRLSTLHV